VPRLLRAAGAFPPSGSCSLLQTRQANPCFLTSLADPQLPPLKHRSGHHSCMQHVAYTRTCHPCHSTPSPQASGQAGHSKEAPALHTRSTTKAGLQLTPERHTALLSATGIVQGLGLAHACSLGEATVCRQHLQSLSPGNTPVTRKHPITARPCTGRNTRVAAVSGSWQCNGGCLGKWAPCVEPRTPRPDACNSKRPAPPGLHVLAGRCSSKTTTVQLCTAHGGTTKQPQDAYLASKPPCWRLQEQGMPPSVHPPHTRHKRCRNSVTSPPYSPPTTRDSSSRQ
jgi:hypothetical protein